MTDCIPADAVRELRERWAARAAKRRGISTEPFDEQAWMAVAEEHCVAELDSLIAQARPCDEGPRTFTMYRRGNLSATHDENQANAADDPQFEGVLFSDGRVAIRWLTAKASVSVWDSLDDAMAIHDHPEYESELVWARPCGDETLREALEEHWDHDETYCFGCHDFLRVCSARTALAEEGKQ